MTSFLDKHLTIFSNPPKEANKANNNARGRSKRLAKNLNITIDIVRDDAGVGYWLDNTGWEDETFCTSWIEVEDKLKSIEKEKSTTRE